MFIAASPTRSLAVEAAAILGVPPETVSVSQGPGGVEVAIIVTSTSLVTQTYVNTKGQLAKREVKTHITAQTGDVATDKEAAIKTWARLID